MSDDKQEKPQDPSQEPSAEDVAVFEAMLREYIDSLLDKAQARINDKTGAKLSVAEKFKVSMAKRMMKIAERYSANAKVENLVKNSNDVLPTLTKVFGEEAMVKALPDKVVNEKVAGACDRLGATELSGLIRKGITPPKP